MEKTDIRKNKMPIIRISEESLQLLEREAVRETTKREKVVKKSEILNELIKTHLSGGKDSTKLKT